MDNVGYFVSFIYYDPTLISWERAFIMKLYNPNDMYGLARSAGKEIIIKITGGGLIYGLDHSFKACDNRGTISWERQPTSSDFSIQYFPIGNRRLLLLLKLGILS